MKKIGRYIVPAFITVVMVAVASVLRAEASNDVVDDVYYWPQDQQKTMPYPSLEAKRTKVVTTPYYNKNVQEIIFLDEDTTQQHSDTVRAIIRNK